jgi:hypothetical protein
VLKRGFWENLVVDNAHRAWWLALGIVSAYGLWEIAHMLLIDFPFNFYEAEVVGDAWRLAQGDAMYPLLEEGPYGGLYAPGYHFLLAGFFSLLPDTMVTARLTSVLSVLLIAWLIIRTENPKNKGIWYLTAFVSLIIWHNTLAQFDLHAKPDTFGVLLSVTALYFAIKTSHKQHWKLAVLSGLFIAAGVITKQTNLFILPPVLGFFLLKKEYRTSFYIFLSFVLSSALLWFIASLTTGPEIWFYVFEQPGAFRMRWGVVGDSIWYIIDQPLILIYGGIFVAYFLKKRLTSADYLIFFSVIFAWPACVLSASKGGGLSNSYQPMYYLVSYGLMLFAMRSSLFRNFTEQKERTARETTWLWSLALVLLITVHINPVSNITTTDWRWNAQHNYEYLADRLEQMEGQIYVPFDNYLTIKAENPLIWSRKWEVETNMSKAEHHPERSSTAIALESAAVVTITHFGWNDESKLEQKLRQHNFKKDTTLTMDQLREYHLWLKE